MLYIIAQRVGTVQLVALRPHLAQMAKNIKVLVLLVQIAEQGAIVLVLEDYIAQDNLSVHLEPTLKEMLLERKYLPYLTNKF